MRKDLLLSSSCCLFWFVATVVVAASLGAVGRFGSHRSPPGYDLSGVGDCSGRTLSVRNASYWSQYPKRPSVTRSKSISPDFVGKNAIVWKSSSDVYDFRITDVTGQVVTSETALPVQGECHFTLDAVYITYEEAFYLPGSYDDMGYNYISAMPPPSPPPPSVPSSWYKMEVKSGKCKVRNYAPISGNEFYRSCVTRPEEYPEEKASCMIHIPAVERNHWEMEFSKYMLWPTLLCQREYLSINGTNSTMGQGSVPVVDHAEWVGYGTQKCANPGQTLLCMVFYPFTPPSLPQVLPP